MTRPDDTSHPNLESYYDSATDRVAIDAHLADCPECRAWLADIHERLGHLACSDFVELVTDYLDRALEESLAARVDDHLRLCEGCRNYLDEMRSTVATIGRVGRVGEPPPHVQAGLIAAFRVWRRTSAGETSRES